MKFNLKKYIIQSGELHSGKDREVIRLARKCCIRTYGFAWVFLKRRAKLAMLQEVIDFSCEVFKDFEPYHIDVDKVFGVKDD